MHPGHAARHPGLHLGRERRLAGRRCNASSQRILSLDYCIDGIRWCVPAVGIEEDRQSMADISRRLFEVADIKPQPCGVADIRAAEAGRGGIKIDDAGRQARGKYEVAGAEVPVADNLLVCGDVASCRCFVKPGNDSGCLANLGNREAPEVVRNLPFNETEDFPSLIVNAEKARRMWEFDGVEVLQERMNEFP